MLPAALPLSMVCIWCGECSVLMILALQPTAAEAGPEITGPPDTLADCELAFGEYCSPCDCSCCCWCNEDGRCPPMCNNNGCCWVFAVGTGDAMVRAVGLSCRVGVLPLDELCLCGLSGDGERTLIV